MGCDSGAPIPPAFGLCNPVMALVGVKRWLLGGLDALLSPAADVRGGIGAQTESQTEHSGSRPHHP